MALLSVDHLSVEFALRAGTLAAVRDVSFTLDAGETLAIVGESGSGKTATALSLMRLHPTPPARYVGGQIHFSGKDLLTVSERQMRQVRGAEIAMIFQDPMTSLNPVKRIGSQIAEAVFAHQRMTRAQAREEAIRALGEIGIPNPERRARSYPHQFSGGMRQRVMIAMALACRPKVLIADEPTTALDVTIQAQIVELLQELQRRHDTAIILITHDLGLVAQMAQRVHVMYAGRTVEAADADDLFRQPLMPYTSALLRSMPQMATRHGAQLRPIAGQPPDLLALPQGCSFAPRCPLAMPVCQQQPPPLVERTPGHQAACVLTPEELRQRQDEREVTQGT